MEKEAKSKGREMVGEHPPYGIYLDRHDLAELLVASISSGGDWIPGKKIQLSGVSVRNNPLLDESVRALLGSGKYQGKQEGKGYGNLLLTPNQIDETVSQAIKFVGIKGLKPLIFLLEEFFPLISSVTLLPNTSVGLKDRRDLPLCKLNSVVMEFSLEGRNSKNEIKKLLEALRPPLGRGISVFSLNIDVESFIDSFADGGGITEKIRSPIKFDNFLYDPNSGQVFLAVAGGGKRELPFDLSGPTKLIKENLQQLYQNANTVREKAAEFVEEKIGTNLELVTRFPYVGLNFTGDDSRVVFVSGASFLPAGDVLFNGGPGGISVLFSPPEGYPLPPIGQKEDNLVTGIGRNFVPDGYPLVPVRNFGLQ